MQLKELDLQTAIEMKDFLEKNYRYNYDYDYLSKKFSINKRKLKVAFKEVTKENIHAFISKVRIERTMHLLKSTDLTIEAIACQVGLEKSNLRKQFKKYTGLLPAEWRRNPSPITLLSQHDAVGTE